MWTDKKTGNRSINPGNAADQRAEKERDRQQRDQRAPYRCCSAYDHGSFCTAGLQRKP
jgi:hypothetical protein